MTQPQVYLAGPITGLTYDDGNSWREQAAKELEQDGIIAWSPLRAKEYLRNYGVMEAQGYFDKVLSNAKGITTRDRWDCMRADVVLANFEGASHVSIGSVMELGWADAARVPIVAVIEEGNVHNHAMIEQVCGFIVPFLAEAIDVVKALVLPRKVEND